MACWPCSAGAHGPRPSADRPYRRRRRQVAAPRRELAIAQRRLAISTELVPLDVLAARPGVKSPTASSATLAGSPSASLVGIHQPAGSTGPIFPAARQSAAAIILPAAPDADGRPDASGHAAPALRRRRPARRRSPSGRSGAAGRCWSVSPRSRRSGWRSGCSRRLRRAARARRCRPPPPAAMPPGRSQAEAAPGPARSIRQVRALLAPGRSNRDACDGRAVAARRGFRPLRAPAPGRFPCPRATTRTCRHRGRPTMAASPPPPTQLALAAPVLRTRIAPVTLTPVTREVPDFPRQAVNAGVAQNSVRARLTVDAAGRVGAVDIIDAQPRRVFDRAVTRTLSRWTLSRARAASRRTSRSRSDATDVVGRASARRGSGAR